MFVICDAADKAFCNWDDAFLVALAEDADEPCACVYAVPGEVLAFRDAQPRAVDQFKQKPSSDLRQCRVFDFFEFVEPAFGEVLLPENVDEPLRALGHRDCFGGILVENLGADEVFAEAFEGGEVFADACGGEFLLNL